MSAAGLDGISNVVWKIDVSTTSLLISRLLKTMLFSGNVPSAWKRSKTVMLFKKGPSDESSSRGDSFL